MAPPNENLSPATTGPPIVVDISSPSAASSTNTSSFSFQQFHSTSTQAPIIFPWDSRTFSTAPSTASNFFNLGDANTGTGAGSLATPIAESPGVPIRGRARSSTYSQPISTAVPLARASRHAGRRATLSNSSDRASKPLPARLLSQDIRSAAHNAKCRRSESRLHGCHLCMHIFARKHDYERHMRIHTGASPYQCDKCSHSFKRSDALLRHKKQHDNVDYQRSSAQERKHASVKADADLD
ncbi:hypothetical protein K437DRAFT_235987 [Tilletiaria anomala UBC 951]|uniref:C2H2-type domain-containing protein n=1 Tax=Tilletiaria anomala (strain ATCC 24038 / CBS 436.72 / UBC 951) TaxID=1037660 RepID=A0A066W2B2_TILAU|nr:uncharacterized protein K437DRAFT_235987 [Tilletiaria anomala UBC 951]KDN45224.1 hypothetical protein K437DRAFT_235987 [Tilletiaria anomala UBC 951]